MTSLNLMPPCVTSVAELMAMAKMMEEEAARRYRDLASRMKLRHEDHLAQLFAFLAEIEGKHADRIEERAHARGTEPLAVLPIDWQVPETFDEEEGSSRLLTPYRALALAVRNEDRAFAFYSYIAADAPDDASRRLAEELAKDELDHAHLLRRERRLAFRREKVEAHAAETRGIPESLMELWSVTAEDEDRAARYHRAFASMLEARDPAAAALFSRAAADEELHAREAEASLGRAPPARQPSAAPGVADANLEDTNLDDALRLLEESFERYSDIAERSRDEAVMNEAQRLGEAAVKRLSLVCGALRDSAIAQKEGLRPSSR